MQSIFTSRKGSPSKAGVLCSEQNQAFIVRQGSIEVVSIISENSYQKAAQKKKVWEILLHETTDRKNPLLLKMMTIIETKINAK